MKPPFLVVDANILFAALLKDSITRKMLSPYIGIKLFTPDFSQKELLHFSNTLSKRLRIQKIEIIRLIGNLMESSSIKIIPIHEYQSFLSQARQITPDRWDAPYFALALKLDCPLWTNDKELKKQGMVKVYSTHELLKEL